MLLADWIAWFTDAAGVPVPRDLSARLGKQIKMLIQSGYSATAIETGLRAWTGARVQRPELPPERLSNYALDAAIHSGPGARMLLVMSHGSPRGNRTLDSREMPRQSAADRNWQASEQNRAVWLASRTDSSGGMP